MLKTYLLKSKEQFLTKRTRKTNLNCSAIKPSGCVLTKASILMEQSIRKTQTRRTNKREYFCSSCAHSLGKGTRRTPLISCNVCGWVHFKCSGLSSAADYHKTSEFYVFEVFKNQTTDTTECGFKCLQQVTLSLHFMSQSGSVWKP